jgi:hypothetical protein
VDLEHRHPARRRWMPSWNAGRAIAAGHPEDDEPFLQLRDDRKLKRGSESGLSTT